MFLEISTTVRDRFMASCAFGVLARPLYGHFSGPKRGFAGMERLDMAKDWPQMSSEDGVWGEGGRSML